MNCGAKKIESLLLLLGKVAKTDSFGKLKTRWAQISGASRLERLSILSRHEHFHANKLVGVVVVVDWRKIGEEEEIAL